LKNKIILQIFGKKKVAALLLLCYLLWASLGLAGNKDEDKRRQLVGLSFFPNIIAVDEDILAKRTQSGTLPLFFVYGNDRKNAEKMARRLKKKVKAIKKNPVEIKVTSELSPADKPVGIFLTEWLPDSEFDKIINFGIAHKIIVFSPFVGDVERGATAGLNISTKIRPSLNLSTLKKSNIHINKVFMRLSKHYD